ncbi:hypothetical protein [Streptomyces sp. NPDC002133]|uniref:hypothetical protein n=1 Tax=Streptomyces sp. NPDC002133 TaxID=3154409 RepID=UPI00332E85FF
MLTTTIFMTIQGLQTTAEASGAGGHRGRRAKERLTFVNLPGRGRHRRMSDDGVVTVDRATPE